MGDSKYQIHNVEMGMIYDVTLLKNDKYVISTCMSPEEDFKIAERQFRHIFMEGFVSVERKSTTNKA